jgi:UDP:flavonoid glycosyltransferase YjiC (YdhE family)
MEKTQSQIDLLGGTAMMHGLPRILFFAEAVSISHVARPLVLASSLDPEEFEVQFACDPRAHWMLKNLPFRLRSISSMPSQRFLDQLRAGSPLYDLPTLRAYVQEDLSLIDDFKPDLIVGDFRLSLSVSAALRKVPYMSIANAYWSPYAKTTYPIPDLPVTRITGRSVAQTVFNAIRPLAFALHARPLNRLRSEFGLPLLGHDVRRTYTEADVTLYADHPSFVPTQPLPPHHQFLGPFDWSPEIPFPKWWDKVPTGRPIVYVNLGSSGPVERLPMIVDALSQLPVSVLVATAGRKTLATIPSNVFIADFLPGAVCSAKASLSISNGGSLSTTQSLRQGTPVLGIVDNMDQHLNMLGVQRRNAGLALRAAALTPSMLQAAALALMKNPDFKRNAARASLDIDAFNATDRFHALLARFFQAERRTLPLLQRIGTSFRFFSEARS